jgi:hypothetical protein
MFPLAPHATSYGMGWKDLQAVRYRNDLISELNAASILRTHVLVLIIRPAENLELRFAGVQRDRPLPPWFGRGDASREFYSMAPALLRGVLNERGASSGQTVTCTWPRSPSAPASQAKASFRFTSNGSSASRRDSFGLSQPSSEGTQGPASLMVTSSDISCTERYSV